MSIDIGIDASIIIGNACNSWNGSRKVLLVNGSVPGPGPSGPGPKRAQMGEGPKVPKWAGLKLVQMGSGPGRAEITAVVQIGRGPHGPGPKRV